MPSLLPLTRLICGPERTVARICREAGALVRCNVKLRDMNVTVPATDEREVEVVASELPLQHGAQLAIDVTLRSAPTSFGTACTNAAGATVAVLEKARRVDVCYTPEPHVAFCPIFVHTF